MFAAEPKGYGMQCGDQKRKCFICRGIAEFAGTIGEGLFLPGEFKLMSRGVAFD